MGGTSASNARRSSPSGAAGSGRVVGKVTRSGRFVALRVAKARVPSRTVTTKNVTSLRRTVSASRVTPRSAAESPVAPGSREAVVADRLGGLLELLEPYLPGALLAARTDDDLQDLAGRISSVLPQESGTAAAVGPVYDTADLVTWLGISRQALHKRVRRHDVLAMKTGDGHTIYPAWQFTGDGAVRPGVAEAVKALAPVMDDWARLLWFSGKSPELDGRSAAEWLSGGGDPASVVNAATRRARRLAQ